MDVHARSAGGVLTYYGPPLFYLQPDA